MFRIIVAGSRDFTDYNLLEDRLDYLLSNKDPKDICIISGGAKGADRLGEQFAKERGLQLKVYPADWDQYGKSAGYKRNVQMAENADALVAFWNGSSKGTKHMIDIAKERNLLIKVIYY